MHVSKSIIVPFTAQKMYVLVNDIDNYPTFLPWCSATEIHSRSSTALEATIYVNKGPVSYTITTQNTMRENELIDMQYKTGPFKYCFGSWQFKPQQQDFCEIIFNIEYEFKNKLLAIGLEPFFKPIADTLIEAFYQRAQQVYV